jgi:sugar phosphate isomerase/epimerase
MGKRVVSLVTGQWADMTLSQISKTAKKLGYDGLELAAWGNTFSIEKAYADPAYLAKAKKIIKDNGLVISTLSTHIIGQCVSDLPDPRLNNFAPSQDKDNPEAIRAWAIDTMKKSAYVAHELGVKVISGFTGSPLWRYFYSYPQTTSKMIEDGFQKVREDWLPILDEFRKYGLKFALEVHPGEIAFDYYSAKKILETFKDRPEFGLNFDPSHLLWQGIRPELFLEDFIDRVYNVHMKDVKVTLDGRSSLLGSYLDFGSSKRGWNFRSLGHGDVDFAEIIRVLNAHHYEGALCVEWEDSGMDRLAGAKEACEFVRRIDFEPSKVRFDDAISNGK